MCVAITLFSQVRSVAQRPETLRLLRAGPGEEKQVEVHALLHVVVPGAARYAKPNSFGLRHHFAFNLALESVLRVRGIAHAGIDRSAQGNNCYEPLLHSSTRFHGFSVNNFSLYPFRGERFFPAILRSEPRCEPSYCSFLVTGYVAVSVWIKRDDMLFLAKIFLARCSKAFYWTLVQYARQRGVQVSGVRFRVSGFSRGLKPEL